MSLLDYIAERETLIEELQALYRAKFEDSAVPIIKRLIEINRVVPLDEDFKIWEDMQFVLTRDKQGQNLKPDYDFTNLGLLFPQDDSAEIAYIVGQFSHSYKEGSNLYPHIHWIQSADTAVTWKLGYKWYNNGEAPPGSFTEIETSTVLYTYISGDLSQISTFPPIDGTGKKISSIVKLKLYRDDNTTTGDVLGDEFDIHFLKDLDGSAEQYIK